jgi:hypothetical protein
VVGGQYSETKFFIIFKSMQVLKCPPFGTVISRYLAEQSQTKNVSQDSGAQVR